MNKNEIFKRPGTIAVWALLLLGLAAAVLILASRVRMENANTRVLAIMEYSQLEELRPGNAQSLLPEIKAMGVTALIFDDSSGGFDEEAMRAARQAGLGVILMTDSGESRNDYLRLLDEGGVYPLFIGSVMHMAPEQLATYGLTVGLVENNHQLSHYPIDGFDAMTYSGPMVRVYPLIPSFQARYRTLGYPGAEEIGNMYYRAVVDRGIRVLWMRNFIDSDTRETITNLEEYAEVISDLQRRISVHGLTLTDEIDVLPDYEPPSALLAILYLSVCAGALLLLGYHVRLHEILLLALLGLAALGCVGGIVLLPELVRTGMSFAACVVFPCLSLLLLSRLSRNEELQGAMAFPLWPALLGTLVSLIPILAGAVITGAILTSTKYMLEIQYFRGVKLSQALPLVYAALVIGVTLWQRRSQKAAWPKLNAKRLLIIIPGILLFCAVVFVFLARTGDGVLSVSVLEQRVRNWFEFFLPVRPRTKEFLVAVPSMMACLWLARRSHSLVSLPFLFFAAIGYASIANTFCHTRAPFMLSLVRTELGVLLGAVIGLIGLSLFWVVERFAVRRT